MSAQGWIDTGRRTGGAPARHPITGEVKREEIETITAFAMRHGWAVEESTDGDFYYTDCVLRKDGDVVLVSLWPGRSKSVALATANGVDIPEPRRERLEKYLIGIKCICPEQPEAIASYERLPHLHCPIHGGVRR